LIAFFCPIPLFKGDNFKASVKAVIGLWFEAGAKSGKGSTWSLLFAAKGQQSRK